MGAAASVAKNVANHSAHIPADPAPAPTASTSMASAEESSLDGENGSHPALDTSENNGDRINGADDSYVHADDGGDEQANVASNGRAEEDGVLQAKATPKTDSSGKKNMVTLNFGAGGSGALSSTALGSPDMSFAEKQRKKKSSECNHLISAVSCR